MVAALFSATPLVLYQAPYGIPTGVVDNLWIHLWIKDTNKILSILYGFLLINKKKFSIYPQKRRVIHSFFRVIHNSYPQGVWIS
jgi:hypothetical protein